MPWMYLHYCAFEKKGAYSRWSMFESILYVVNAPALLFLSQVESTRASGGRVVVLCGSEYFDDELGQSPHQNKLPPWESFEYVAT